MKNLLLCAGLFSSLFLAAGPIIDAKGLNDFKLDKNQKKLVSVITPGTFKVSSPNWICFFTQKNAKLDMNKKYQLTITARNTPGAPAKKGYFWGGAQCFTKDNRAIGSEMVNFSERYGTLTVPAKIGDKQLKFKTTAKWDMGRGYECATFNAKKDLSDLPNGDYSPIFTKLTKSGDVYTATLRSPLKKAYPAGTLVRNHRSGATYMYFGSGVPTTEWKTFKLEIKGDAGHKGRVWGKWHTGTASVNLVFMMQAGTNLEFRDFKLIEL